MRYIFISLVLVLLATILFACNAKKSETTSAKQKMSNRKVEGFIVTPSKIEESLTVSGTLKPIEETTLMPEVSGRVVNINLTEGEIAQKGDLLIKLFDGDLQAQLKKVQAQLKIAEETENRLSQLIKVNGISQTEYDQAQLQVNSLNAEIEIIKVQIRKTEVRAPYTGTIGLRNISLGAQVTQATALTTIRDVSKLKLDFSVPEKYSKEIKTGTKVTFFVQGDEKPHEAVVMATEQGIEVTTRSLKVRSVVREKAPSLMPGAFANIELQLKQKNNALMIPTQAIIPQERNKQIIIAQNGKAKFVPVKTGIRNTSRIEILSGLKPGDTVVTTGIMFIRPKSPLRFAKITRDSI